MSCVRPRQEALLSRLRADDGEASTVIRPERGAVTASIIILPVVMFAILLGIDFAMILHGRNVATAAAQDGLHAAQLQGATAGNGRVAAQNTLNLFGGIRSAQVSVTPSTDTISVTITGEVRTILNTPFADFDVTRSGPVERFYFESERTGSAGSPGSPTP